MKKPKIPRKSVSVYFLCALALLAIGLFFWQNALAAYQIQFELPGAAAGTEFSEPASYIRYFFIFGLSLLAFLAVTTIAAGGVIYITAGSLTKVDQAKDLIKGAIFGLILLMGSYLILYTLGGQQLTNLTAPALDRYNIDAPDAGLEYTASQIKSSSLIKGPYADLINKYAGKYNLDPNFVKAVIQAESGGNPSAKSSAGACGLMQLMPVHNLSNCLNPEENIAAGTKFLAALSRRYNSDQSKMLAAYNWGPGNLERKCGGDPTGCSRLPSETKIYLSRVSRYYNEFSS
ncbi:MAG: transglycosylase SLT domain-containing protein [Candidatus Portnoybacteria bacterium]|jgi:hypothetical protein|nr:transglycosylase SLT domain-containing protein [Candidatus Portnoybacteria bacterium]